MAYTHRRIVRFDDVDFARVVYFPRFFSYCHDAFEDFFTDEVKLPYAHMVVDKRVGFPIVRTEADFKQPLRFGEAVRIELSFERISSRSVVCLHQVFRAEETAVAATVRIIHACIDVEHFAPTEIPADIRAVMQQHLVPAA